MRLLFEAGAALGLAVALHLGAFAVAPKGRSATAAGDAGQARVSLQAADATLAALIADWDRPPEAAPVVQAAPVPAPVVQPAPPVANDAPPPPLLATVAPPVLAAPRDQAAPAPSALAPAPVANPPPARKADPVTTPAAPPPAPKAKPKPAAPADRAAQKAAGSGGGAQAGDGGAAEASLSKAGLSSLRVGWGAAVKARVERRKGYPADARGATGSVTVRLTLAASGALVAVSVVQASGVAALDQAAVQAVQAAAPFPSAPQGVPPGNQTFTLRLRFER